MSDMVIHTDGAARGNPGLSGIGVLIEYDGGKKEYSEFIGQSRTNNEAEYEALVFALKKAKQIAGKEKSRNLVVNCYADSELMVKQLNHQYKLKDEKIQRYFIEIWNLMLDFGKITFNHIPREQNKKADQLANEAIDRTKAESRLF